MKKLFLLSLCVMSSLFINAQESKTIMVDVNGLPKEVLQKIQKKQKMDEVKNNVKAVKEMASDAKSIGHEIGVAVDEALGAVTKHAETFGKTDVGKFTMAMVAVSVLKDQIPVVYDMIIGVIIGVPFLFFY